MGRTDSFREQHKKALELVGAIQKNLDPAKLAVDAQAVGMDLAKLTGAIKVHLSMEDNSLYPGLLNHPNADVKKVAEKFTSEMKSISNAFMDYSKKWNAVSIKANPADFIKETTAIFNALGNRIQREESELYPLADKG